MNIFSYTFYQIYFLLLHIFHSFSPFSLMNKYFKDYFPIEMVKTADLNPERKYLLCSHPHGVMPAGINIAVGTNACGWNEKFPGNFMDSFIKII